MDAITQETLLDGDRLSELADEVGEEDLIAVLLMFLEEAEGEIAHLSEGLDDEAHAKSAHFLRSGALNIGFAALAEAAREAADLPATHRPAAGTMLTGLVARSRAAVMVREAAGIG